MDDKKCKRRKLLIKEFIYDWDELNISFKALIFVGIILFAVAIFIAFTSTGESGEKTSLEVSFRAALASVIGFLLSSNIKFNNKKNAIQIEEIKKDLNKVQSELETLDNIENTLIEECNSKDKYRSKDINLVQIIVALGICTTCICVLFILLITENLDNTPSISQIRDLMCSSVGFLIGESKKK